MTAERSAREKPELGGYFGLDLPEFTLPFGDFVAVQSGRAAMHAALKASGWQTVYAPSYICDSILLAAKTAGLNVALYDLDERLLPSGVSDRLPQDTGLIYVNYFGLSQTQVESVLDRFGPKNVVLDLSQSLFAPRSSALADVYSPRKFAGLPDGGLLKTDLEIDLPDGEDCGTLERLDHLFLRYGVSARAGYDAFNAARLSLYDTQPVRMSAITRKMMTSIDWETVRQRRLENFARIDALLGGSNARSWSVTAPQAPLCYPYTRTDADIPTIRKALAEEHNIFSPTYWPDVIARAQPGSLEVAMVNATLFLPIDQRITPDQIDFIADRVLRQLG
ncbi:MAG: hypothetical protein AAGG56_11150 [Pseudomonadota bacterium]